MLLSKLKRQISALFHRNEEQSCASNPMRLWFCDGCASTDEWSSFVLEDECGDNYEHWDDFVSLVIRLCFSYTDKEINEPVVAENYVGATFSSGPLMLTDIQNFDLYCTIYCRPRQCSDFVRYVDDFIGKQGVPSKYPLYGSELYVS